MILNIKIAINVIRNEYVHASMLLVAKFFSYSVSIINNEIVRVKIKEIVASSPA